jgi:cell division protein ZapB
LTLIDFFTYSGIMEPDLKSLEEKITKLISLCTNLREENIRLRSDLTQTKDNMLQASNRLEGLLESLPEGAESVGLES